MTSSSRCPTARFLQSRTDSLSLSLFRFLSVAHGKPSAHAPTQRACGHFACSYGPFPPPPSPPPQNNAPLQWRMKLGRNVSPEELSFLFPPASSLNSDWRAVKRKSPPRLFLSFRPSQNQTVGYDFSAQSQLGRASAFAQWQARHPLVPAAALIAVVAHLLQRLAFEWLALRILHNRKKEKSVTHTTSVEAARK